jgi:hypothetical protein
MTDQERALLINRIKAVITEKFSPAIDFQAPYAKVMLQAAADGVVAELTLLGLVEKV